MGNSGKIRTEETKIKISKKLQGIKKTTETIQKMRAPKSEEHRKNIGKSHIGMKRTNETKSKISKAMKNVDKQYCKYCHNYFYPWHYSRYHGINCKLFE
jgi:protoheme ferro-lyase